MQNGGIERGMRKGYQLGSGLLANVVTLMCMDGVRQCNVPHAGGMIAATSKYGGIIIKDTKSVRLE